MGLNYRRLGDCIRAVKVKNSALKANLLLGINIDKFFMPSVANVIGTDMANYRVVNKNQFACNRMHVGRDFRIPIALSTKEDPFMVSPAYDVFEIMDISVLLPEYLMMWFSRKEFDRNTWFHTDADVRGGLPWKSFCDLKLPIPSLEKQLELVREFQVIQNRIKINNQLISKLEETIQTIYKQWFVDFEFPNENGLKYKSSGGEIVESESGEIPLNWTVENLKSYCLKIGSGSTPKGGKGSYHKSGTSLIRSMNVHDFVFSPEDLAFIDDRQAKSLEGVSLKAQDILLNITGVSVARCCIVPEFVLPARVNQHVMIIRPKMGFYLSNYLMCLLCYSDNKTKLLGISQSGSTREAITKAEIDEFKILIPNKIIAKRFDEHANKIRKMIEIKILNATKLNELKNLLLSKMTKVEIEEELT